MVKISPDHKALLSGKGTLLGGSSKDLDMWLITMVSPVSWGVPLPNVYMGVILTTY